MNKQNARGYKKKIPARSDTVIDTYDNYSMRFQIKGNTVKCFLMKGDALITKSHAFIKDDMNETLAVAQALSYATHMVYKNVQQTIFEEE